MATSSARCVEHPGRVAEAPCIRCGAFRCDWCVKLAPSWGPGLCAACQKRGDGGGAVTKLPRSRLFMLVSVGVLLSPFVLWWELSEAFGQLRDEALRGAAAVTLTVGGMLMLWNVAAIVLAALRHPAARTALLVYFGIRLALAMLAAVVADGGGFVVWWPVVLNALVFVYVGWSAEAGEFLRPPRAKTAGDILEEDER
ncbi:MAG: hypothetical protein JNK82_25030 [Myxococcaceae bacterium]|nr:hypothetical protein [Myxococcaceae bacterium]